LNTGPIGFLGARGWTEVSVSTVEAGCAIS
jgi:hypothetical protein